MSREKLHAARRTAAAATASTSSARRLTREARLASTLAHPFICTIFEAGEIDQQAFIAMERVAGEPLSALVGRQRLSPDRVVHLGVQMAEAFEHAHAHQVDDGRLRVGRIRRRITVGHS